MCAGASTTKAPPALEVVALPSKISTPSFGYCRSPALRRPVILLNGYAGAISERQPAMYFPLGGGSLKGVGKPGEIVWSRVFVEGGALHADLGRGTVVSLPAAETERRWREVTVQWPIVHTILHGVSQNQMMARHRANHLNVAYAPSVALADKALATKAAMLAELGVHVHLCGVTQ